ncbi:hypothetical protein [Pseudoclavibacter sp. VKM Ac-2867]|uniref:hypothetical protein n=1 Tax=Pseudoclavibacter sp. VKM Ac-2867 TaxID=2783829 RepID=UPI00188CB2D0|nr:hypothetical protein [Pseudoclavibacter sp. VKM Ac-2867]MBF4459462.1 hypothetical protein [Pseudoclavibacter sp. VKM Ac-2867]
MRFPTALRPPIAPDALRRIAPGAVRALILATAVIQTVTLFAYGWIGANVGFTAILAFALLTGLLTTSAANSRAFDRLVDRATFVLAALVMIGAAIFGVRAGFVHGDVVASLSWYALMVATTLVLWVRPSEDLTPGAAA